ncbi:MAG: hypothetical protein A9Z00_08575 [Thermobacillus sp. ZCTH02-B1]|uniref:YcnI family protein n=1 Tax=Thermobacillus sp. ZCTH02-B1 TaxID=1858795 RepID=UPI000B570840|nr:YcnI family protein [Thermobacillus sp. ZCTH02-B1]OUM95466.1 MAG: hypothetical protein A9Z00_08575 [Thermobacillus sp. ZCTH02-B1]
MKRIIAAAAAFALFLTAAWPASAHVTISPQEAVQGSYMVFTVRVPSEKEGTETTAVRVVFPEGVSVSRFEPKPGWTVAFERNADQAITEVTWTAEPGHGLDVTEFTEFRMSGRVLPDVEPGTRLVWKAYQHYADGSVVEWIGAPDTDSPTPAPVTVVVPGDPVDDGHGGTQGAASAANDGDGGSADTRMLVMLIVSWILSITAFTLSLVLYLEKRKQRARN